MDLGVRCMMMILAGALIVGLTFFEAQLVFERQ
jgi:hypothetical protein